MVIGTWATVQAQVIVPLEFNLSSTMMIQNPNFTNNGTTTIFPAPVRTPLTTLTLLPQLAADEFALGNYTNHSFPAGAHLALFYCSTNFSASHFAVIDSSGKVLVDVSDIMNIQVNGNKEVSSGKRTNATGLISGTTDAFLVRLNYDDTGAAGGSLIFMFEALLEASGGDTVLSTSTHTFRQNWSVRFVNGSGEGAVNGFDFVLHGTAWATGSGVFVY